MRETTPIVGARHMGIPEQTACLELRPDAPLILHREKDNPSDSNAVRISNITGVTVGYVTRVTARIVARWIDAGWLVTGRCIKAARITPDIIKYPWAELHAEPPKAMDVQRKKQMEKIRTLERVK